MVKTIAMLVAAITGGLCVALTSAQKSDSPDEPVGIFATRAQYEQFMTRAKQLASGPESNAELRALIPLLNDIALGKPIGWTANRYHTERSLLDLLADQRVREELEMVDEQYDEMKRLNDQLQRRMADQIRQLELTDPQALASQLTAIRQHSQAEMRSLLLPHQIDRLRQLRLQNQLRHRSLIDALCSEPLKSRLEISDEQARDLKKAHGPIERDLQREMARLREKAREKLLARLKPAQRSALKEMLGEPAASVPGDGSSDEPKAGPGPGK